MSHQTLQGIPCGKIQTLRQVWLAIWWTTWRTWYQASKTKWADFLLPSLLRWLTWCNQAVNTSSHSFIPSYNSSMLGCQLSDTETRTTLWRPQCFNKKIALLGTFCVAATTDDDDKDPNHKLPRITFEVRSYPISHEIKKHEKCYISYSLPLKSLAHA